jgi:16S rRNA G966 N2-methylase RsmD
VKTIDDVLSESRIDENNDFFLPDYQIERKLYLKVAERLGFFGWSWHKGKKRFLPNAELAGVLKTESSRKEIIHALLQCDGDNIKKKTQFFETPEHLCKEIVDSSLSTFSDMRNLRVLEPSAGRGAFIKALASSVFSEKIGIVDCVELDKTNFKFLCGLCSELENLKVYPHNADFLQYTADKKYDLIIANPPFSKGQDVDHVMHMYELLADGGRLYSLMSPHAFFAQDSKSRQFRDFIENIDCVVDDIPSGTFKDSGTTIATKIIKIFKSL